MPLINLETVNPNCRWALWEIKESFENLCEELDIKNESERIENIKNDRPKREDFLPSLRNLIKRFVKDKEEPNKYDWFIYAANYVWVAKMLTKNSRS